MPLKASGRAEPYHTCLLLRKTPSCVHCLSRSLCNEPHMKPTLIELEVTSPNSSFEFDDASRSIKTAWAYAGAYKLGPPLVPVIIAVRRIMEYIGKATIRKKLDFVHLVCRYWSLKREARRGAPLLKRLHLEPWTAGAVGKVLTDEEVAMKLQVYS